MVEDELGATSVGSDASPKFTLKAVGDASVYEFKVTRSVAAALCHQLATALGAFESVDEEPAVGEAVDLEGSLDMRASPKI